MKRLRLLLNHCRQVKTKRLLFWFAQRHGHLAPGSTFLNPEDYDLGGGKRVLVKERGRLDPTFQITVPESMHPRYKDYYVTFDREENYRQLQKEIAAYRASLRQGGS